MNHADRLARILSDIRALQPFDHADALDILNCMHGKFPLSDHGRLVMMLFGCCQLAEELCEFEASNEAAADWVAQRDALARIADTVPVTFAAREVPEFLSTAI